jgi:ABC-type amino acid transport substrate-binding protein
MSVISVCLVYLPSCSSDEQVKPLKPLRVATGEWEPFVGENLPHSGPLAVMVSTILHDLEYVPEYQFFDWNVVEIHLESGYPGFAFPIIISEDRKNKGFSFSEPLHTFDYVLFYKAQRKDEFQSLQSLKQVADAGYKIGRIRGYAKLDAIKSNQAYIEVPTAIAGFEDLADSPQQKAGNEQKIDFLLESKTVGLGILESSHIANDKNDFLYLGQNGRDQLISRASLGLMLSQKVNPELLEKINNSILKNKKFFDSLRSRTNATTGATGYLSADDDQLIRGCASLICSDSGILIPRYSRILIVEWGAAYKQPLPATSDSVQAARSHVKLLNGPMRGKLLWVDTKHINLE